MSCDTNHRIDVRACDDSRRDIGKGLKLNCAKRGGCEAGAKRVNCNSLGISIVEQLSSTVPEVCNNRPTRFPLAREASSIADQGKGWIRSLLVLLIEMEGVLLKSKQLRTTALQCLTVIHLGPARLLGGNAIAPPGQLLGEPLQPNRLVRCIADLER